MNDQQRPSMERAGLAPISVIVPVKNEAENLARCLPALAWADEVFVVDSQSADETARVAAEHGASVVQFHFNGSYPKKKNWALENLPFRNEWVLIVDADEVVVPELAEEIARRTAADEADGFYLNMKYFFLGRRIRHCGYAEAWNLRLFKHRLGRYEMYAGRARHEDRRQRGPRARRAEGQGPQARTRAGPSRLPLDRGLGREAQPLCGLGSRDVRAVPPRTHPRDHRAGQAVQAHSEEDLPPTPDATGRPIPLCLCDPTGLSRRQPGPGVLHPAGVLRFPGLGECLRGSLELRRPGPSGTQTPVLRADSARFGLRTGWISIGSTPRATIW